MPATLDGVRLVTQSDNRRIWYGDHAGGEGAAGGCQPAAENVWPTTNPSALLVLDLLLSAVELDDKALVSPILLPNPLTDQDVTDAIRVQGGLHPRSVGPLTGRLHCVSLVPNAVRRQQMCVLDGLMIRADPVEGDFALSLAHDHWADDDLV
jgi:hypothetical protein